MAKKKSKKGSKGDSPKGKGGKKGKKDKAPPSPKGKSSPKKTAAEEAPPPPIEAPPPPPPPPPAPPPEPPGNEEQKRQTQALKDLMERKMNVWQKILVSPKDEDRKEGLKSYKNMAEEELRIIARNISKTKLQELIDQKVNYFVQIGVSDAEEQKLVGLQGFKQVSEEERVLAAMEAPALARRVFGDVTMGEQPPVSLQGPPSSMAPEPAHLSPGGRSPDAYKPGDAHRGTAWAYPRHGDVGGGMPGTQPDRTAYSGGGSQQPPPWPMPGRQLAQDQSQLMEDALEMQRRLPKRRLPPSGGTVEVHNKSRLVSEFVEKLAAEIASKRISRDQARDQLKDVVELENALAETLVSATSVKPDMTEEKLAAIAKMYREISHTLVSHPDMNPDDALSKLKTVAAMENELTQALVSDEEIAKGPFRSTTAEESAYKLQQMKLNLADELQKNMAVSQPDANKIQESIKKLYELEVKLMDKLFAAKTGKGKGRGVDKEQERDLAVGDEPKRVFVKKSKKPATVVEISFSDSDDSGVTPVIRVVDSRPTVGDGEQKSGQSCPLHGCRTKPCPEHAKKDKGDKPCPLHSDPRGKPKITWSTHPVAPESLDLSDNEMQLLTGKDKRRGRLDDLGKSFGDNFGRGSQERDFNVLVKTRPPPPFMPPAPFPPPPAFPPYPGVPTDSMYPQYAPYMAAPNFPQPPLMQPYMYPPQEDVRRNVVCGDDRPPVMDDRPPAEPRIIVPTRYKGLLPDQPVNGRDDELRTILGDNSFYSKETWETKPCMPPSYMSQYQTYPIMEAHDHEYALPRYRPQPNVDVGIDASSMYPAAVTDTEFDQENGRVLGLETGIQITFPSQTNIAATAVPSPATAVQAQQPIAVSVAAPAATSPQMQATTTTISATDAQSVVTPPRRRRRSRRPRQSASRFRRRRFSDFGEGFEDEGDDSDLVRPRRRTRSRPRSRSRRRSPRARRWRGNYDDDFGRLPPSRRRRRQRSKAARRDRPSRADTVAEEVPGVPFWDWICKSICSLLPFSRDGNGSKTKRGANIQRLVDDVMATSQEVVQAKRKLQSNNGSVEASVRSMGDLESKLWKLIDLEVDLVNELARYRWSGDVQDPKAEMKLNTAEEKIWRVIGVQTRLAQDLGDWRKTSTRSLHNSGMDTRMSYTGQYGNFGPQGNYGQSNGFNNPGSYANPSSQANTTSMYAGPGSRGSMGNQEGFANTQAPGDDETEEVSGSASPSQSPSPPAKPKRKASKASKKSKRSRRQKKKGKRRSPAVTGSPGSPSNKSTKKRSKSRARRASSSTSNTTTNTSNYTTEQTSTENTSSSNASTSVGSDPDSVTITNTIVISSEMDDDGVAKPSAVSWKSPSKEFLSSIDRSQTTPVEWETKKKGKYIYVRAKPGSGPQMRETKRSASHGAVRRPRDSLEVLGRGGRSWSRKGRWGGSPDRRGAPGYDIRVHRKGGRRRRGDDDDGLMSATLSVMTSDGTDNAHGSRWSPPRQGGRRRRFRSVGPIASRGSYQSRSQWSL